MPADKTKIRVRFPAGRMINGNIFVKDQFNDAATPSYKIEVGFEPKDVTGEATPSAVEIDNALFDAVEAQYGKAAVDDYIKYLDGQKSTFKWSGPWIDGNDIAADRKARGKKGDAYEGKMIIRSNTQFNKYGQNGDGGIDVRDADLSEILPNESAKVYNGCFVKIIGTVGVVEAQGKRYVKFYLDAVQKVRDGEPLRGEGAAGMFENEAGSAPAAASEGRRRRAG